MLRRLSRQLNDERDGIKLERKRSKRERISQFFRAKSTRKQQPLQYNEAPIKANSDERASLQQCRSPDEAEGSNPEPPVSSPDTSKTAILHGADKPSHELALPKEHQAESIGDVGSSRSEALVDATQHFAYTEEDKGALARPRSTTEHAEESDLLTREAIDALFSGAPRFSVEIANGRLSPNVSYPWDTEVKHDDATDSIPPAQPSYMAATAHTHNITGQPVHGAEKEHQVYPVKTVEMPSWLSAQGVEPGSVGFAHFVELPRADNLVTETQHDASDQGSVEAIRNKEQMQTNPERIGIRAVDMNSLYDRLVEFQDLYEAFQQSPERITILNNQSPGDLYAHLFSTFLTPPGYAGANIDPTGLQVQVLAILKVLNLKGIWHDFSLVEWRIRLGQILFSDPELEFERSSRPLWTERDILLLQISLSCELLLRLDAISATKAGEVDDLTHVSAQEIETFANLTTSKTDWDMILARRFLENILVIKGDDNGALTPSESRGGLFSILGGRTPKELPRSDIIFLPQHQSRQLSGLLHFAESIKWPTIDSVLKLLAEKLGVSDQNAESTMQSTSPGAWSFNPTTPSVVSVYGTPLQTPRSVDNQLDDYFGRVQKPAVSRNNSRSLRMPLSKTLLSLEDGRKPGVVDIGGWLSRSFLTGLILPGEAISHFLISTLLENDKLAMSALGDSADLYGGFVFESKTWWSKASIVGRTFACIENSRESMGWVYVDKLPEGVCEGWHSIRSEQLPIRSRIEPDRDLVAADSSALLNDANAPIKSTDLIIPGDLDALPNSPVRFLQWDLTPLNTDLIDDDTGMGPATDSDVFTPSLTFRIGCNTEEHVVTLTHEVQFVTSWPCFSPASTSAASPRHVTRRPVAGNLSHTSSKRSISTKLSRRNSHGFEPLLSHPPEATDIGPQRSYVTDEDDEQAKSPTFTEPLVAHPLHVSYQHKIMPVTGVLDSNYVTPFTMTASDVPTCSSSTLLRDGHDEGAGHDDQKTVLVLDAQGTSDYELLARAWCAERGFHAVIGRVERTCLACCIREARGLGINIVIRT